MNASESAARTWSLIECKRSISALSLRCRAWFVVLVCRLHIVAMVLFVTLVPDAKEISPEGSQGAKYPVGPCESLSADFAVSEKQILTDTPLGSDMTVEQLAPAYGGLFSDQLVVALWVADGCNWLVSEP